MSERQRPNGYTQVGFTADLGDDHKCKSASEAQTGFAEARMTEITSLHRYAADKLAASLACTEALSRASLSGPGLTPMQRAALIQLRREYLWAILTLVSKGGLAIVEDVRQGARKPQRNAEQMQRIDQISQMYVQHARTILRRKI